ncbi:MAG: hypothetical protein IBX60_08080 [Candidatus Aminicenantes bacterium]|nr:hypothetical protein [Candidatus Aminicenantes bacterium]
MTHFLEIKCLEKEEEKRIIAEIEERILQKKKEGLLTEKEIKEIGAMKLNPLPDIQDVQSVYEDIIFKNKQKL